MSSRLFFFALLSISPFLALAHLPSYGSAFKFPDNIYSRALCTTTTCPPRYYQHNKTSIYGSPSYYSKQSWSKVYLKGGESLHFEFGVPYLPALEYPAFRPTIYLIGYGLPDCEAFGYPKPQVLEYPTFDLPYGYYPKVLRFHLPDPVYEPAIYYERHLDATFANYLNYTVPVECDGDVYIVVESNEKRIVEYFVAVGETEGFPTGGSTTDIASVEDTKYWAQGKNPSVGGYCKRRGYYERE
ncbi:hypothetical protein ABW19_dt0201822 [Dactylella cylindrospora]|nr:hypothetical protein ABW19_dt0201822 [Dactylella cylindrospora]